MKQDRFDRMENRAPITAAAYPLSLAGSHGRIAAYRRTLEQADAALADATPYVNNARTDPANSPWRRETAETTFAAIRAARDRIAAELTVKP